MFIQSTVIYFGEAPVGYDLYKTSTGFALRPGLSNENNGLPPAITVVRASDGWQVEGVQDEEVWEQVNKLIQVQALLRLSGEMSAAS